MSKSIWTRTYGLLTLVMLLMAMPQPALAYVDPGSGAMLWQIAAAAVIGSLFYVRKIFAAVRGHLRFGSRHVQEFPSDNVSNNPNPRQEKVVETR